MEEQSKVTNTPKGRLPKGRTEKHLLRGAIRRCKVMLAMVEEVRR